MKQRQQTYQFPQASMTEGHAYHHQSLGMPCWIRTAVQTTFTVLKSENGSSDIVSSYHNLFGFNCESQANELFVFKSTSSV